MNLLNKLKEKYENCKSHSYKKIFKNEDELINKMVEAGFKGTIKKDNHAIIWTTSSNECIKIFVSDQDTEVYILYANGTHDHIEEEDLLGFLKDING